MYTIYHIEGVKIGCSNNPKARVRAQGYSVFQVLEVHEDIQVASKREIDLQLEYGYGRDCNAPYTKSAKFGTFEGRSKAGKISGPIQGKKNVETGHLSRIGKIGGKKNVESGHISNLGKISMAKLRTCPYCSKTMKGSIYGRWHGPRCKLVPVTT
jgi:hypothetical protein